MLALLLNFLNLQEQLYVPSNLHHYDLHRFSDLTIKYSSSFNGNMMEVFLFSKKLQSNHIAHVSKTKKLEDLIQIFQTSVLLSPQLEKILELFQANELMENMINAKLPSDCENLLQNLTNLLSISMSKLSDEGLSTLATELENSTWPEAFKSPLLETIS